MRFSYVIAGAVVLVVGVYLLIPKNNDEAGPPSSTPASSELDPAPPAVPPADASTISESLAQLLAGDSTSAESSDETVEPPGAVPSGRSDSTAASAGRDLPGTAGVREQPDLPEAPATAALPSAPVELDDEAGPEGLSEEAFRKAINAWPAPERCAAELKLRDETVTIRLTMEIDADGRARVRSAERTGRTARALVRCLEASLASLDFPAEPGRARVVRVATFVF